jgi:methanol--5-hydroxybenzimidazolylcobamide Co-methyltransferase
MSTPFPAYGSEDELLFGTAKRPVLCGYQVAIGDGEVLPEVNFTLPPMRLNEAALASARERFRDIVTRVLQRAVELEQEALVLEFEHLYEFTRYPDWGALVTADIKKVMAEFHERYGLRTALRVTVADIRDQERPPRMRTGRPLQTMLQAFVRCADAGADILSIESTGGKEVSDQALMEGNLEGLLLALGLLAPADMAFLWEHIVEIARQAHVVPGGDTACGFANTAMQLAHQGLIPKVLAAVVRLMSAPRSLVAVEQGATGPLKDCGYENPILKAVAGVPISMEGKSSACAHSSPLGNIAAMACDLWSNESVQDVRLLGGFAPEVFTEILIYDCRLMNTALRAGQGATLRDWFVRSDSCPFPPSEEGWGPTDPQALMLEPHVVYGAARRLVEEGPDPYARAVAMTRWALEVLNEARAKEALRLDEREERWLERLMEAADALPPEPETLRRQVETFHRSLFLPEEYGLTP